MAIQMRRGKFTEFLPSKLMPGEWAVVQGDDPDASDGKSVYVAFAAGVVKRMATYVDMVDSCKTAINEAIDLIATETAEQLTAKVEATDKSVTDAEASRVAAERQRVSAESSRASAESNRASAESARALAEQGRRSAETLRVSAEEDRVDEFNEVVSEAENVDASLTGTVVSVTNRKGDTSSVDMAVACENAVKEVGDAVESNADEIAKAERSIVDAVGLDSYVLPVGDRFALSDYDDESVSVSGGTLCLQGKRATRQAAMWAIAAGTSGTYRHDIVGFKYTASTGMLSLVKATGTPASTESAAADPDFDEGDMLNDGVAAMPMYRVKLSGTTIQEPEPMFSVLTPLSDLASVVGNPMHSINPAAHTGFYMSCYETVAGVSVGYNVNPSQTLAKGGTVATITTEKAFANTGTHLLRGTHAGHQSGMFATFGSDGHTITLTTEQTDTFAVGDTGSFLIPCVWAL